MNGFDKDNEGQYITYCSNWSISELNPLHWFQIFNSLRFSLISIYFYLTHPNVNKSKWALLLMSLWMNQITYDKISNNNKIWFRLTFKHTLKNVTYFNRREVRNILHIICQCLRYISLFTFNTYWAKYSLRLISFSLFYITLWIRTTCFPQTN